MSRFIVVIHPEVRKALRFLRKSGRSRMATRILEKLHALESDPIRPRPGLDIKRIAGTGGRIIRLRIGDCRVLYEVDPGSRRVYVATLFHRSRGHER